MTGYFRSPTITFDTTTLTNVNGGGMYSDVFVAKYDTNGNVLWAKSAGSIDGDEGWGICTDANGNVFVTGFKKLKIITLNYHIFPIVFC